MAMAREVRTHIEIDASPEVVWNVLTDFARYPDWNPFIRSVSGVVAVGEMLSFVVATGPDTTVATRARLLALEPHRRLVWGGGMPLNLFRGEHRFEIEPVGTGVRFVDSERFTGPLSRFLITDARMRAQTRAFMALDSALRARAESTMRGVSHK
jgi:hypothetical protein